MKSTALTFERPHELQASQPPEARGLARDEVRLLVSSSAGHEHARFVDLADYLTSGDLVVVNRSATVPASLPARHSGSSFLLNLSTHYGGGLWLAEPRYSISEPGPLPVQPGDSIEVAGASARMVAPHPQLSRLWFVEFADPSQIDWQHFGQPIRYGYVDERFPLAAYQTLFSRIPGSAEMPSAARPFTPRVVARLRKQGVALAGITLHTGVSSLEVESDNVEDHVLYAEPYHVPPATARAVDRARREGRRVIAVGTTVVRALESAWDGQRMQPQEGFTSIFLHPGRPAQVVDGLITGLHDPRASHVAMLYAIAGQALIQAAYTEAVAQGYLWHEFGDSHLILTND